MMNRTRASHQHKALSLLLRELREDAGLTQRDIARELGRAPSWVSDVETGQHRVTVVEFFELAEVLDFDPIVELSRWRKTTWK